MRLSTLLPLLAVVACGPGQQPAPAVTDLAAPVDTLLLADTEITDVVWLGGSRWAVLAPQAKTVRILDLAARTSRPLGVPGRDYVEPYALTRSGDSLHVSDWGERQITIWTLGARKAGILEAPPELRGVLPRARDAEGWWYAELRPFPGPDGSGNLDSGAVVRWRPGSMVDTLVGLTPYVMDRVTRNGASRYERVVFSGTDQWGLRADGTLWLMRVHSNSLHRCTLAGACRGGPALRDRVLEVTAQDREYFLQGFPPEHRTLAEGIPYAVIKPPFDAAWLGSDGSVWLQQSRMLTDSTRAYRRLDSTGVAIRDYRIPNAQRMAAADSTSVLVIDPVVPGPGHRVLRYVLP
jgi:hypothetical protein